MLKLKIAGGIFFTLLCAQVFAQRVNGIVIDKATGLAIPHAVVKMGYYTQLTSVSGDFFVTNLHFGDTIKISSLGYKPSTYVIGMRRPDTIVVYLSEKDIMLNNVTVSSQRNTKLDSINERKEFTRIFAYKPPVFTDIFLTVDPYEYKPYDYITSDHNTTSLVGIDLLSVAGLFGKVKTHQSNVREIAEQDEGIRYVDTRFSRQKIASLTHLQDKPLNDFIVNYRPRVEDIKKMTDYDLIVYIKKCYALFMQQRNSVDSQGAGK